jgi:hypothetical protein
VLALDATGSFYDAALAVYTGLTVDGLTPVASARYDRRLRTPVRAGVTYRIAVDTAYTGWNGPVSLGLALKDPPDNDAFSSATPLTGTAASDDSTTAVASKEPGEPAHAGYSGGGSVWWTWTAPADAAVTVDTTGSAMSTSALAVYTGDQVAGLVPVASNSSYSSTARTLFRAVAGTTYRVAIDRRYASSWEGAVRLNLATRDLPLNDAFASAVDLGGADTASAAGHHAGASAEPGEPEPPQLRGRQGLGLVLVDRAGARLGDDQGPGDVADGARRLHRHSGERAHARGQPGPGLLVRGRADPHTRRGGTDLPHRGRAPVRQRRR